MPISLVPKERASRQYADLKARYRASGRPVPVSFRALAPEVGSAERATHLLHPYPAKLLRNIPAFFLSVTQLAPEGTVVWDPFCGSGTVLLEAMCAGFESAGLDVNPLAALISRVKTTPLDAAAIVRRHRGLLRFRRACSELSAPDVVNVRHWFHPHVVRQLTEIEAGVSRMRGSAYRDFFRLCLSACARRVSLANPRVSVPVRLRPEAYPAGHALRARLESRLRMLRHIDVWKVFSGLVVENTLRVRQLAELPARARCEVLTGDARTWDGRPSSGRCSLVITSPPYLGAQKYVRATSLSLNWLRLAGPASLRGLERATVGREHLSNDEYLDLAEVPPCIARAVGRAAKGNALRAQIAAHYAADLGAFFTKLRDWLVPRGRCVLIIGPNTLCGQHFDTPGLALALAQGAGLSLEVELVDQIRSRGLMTSRNRSASVINREHVLVLRRRSDV